MLKKVFYLPLLFVVITFISVSCDKDYNELGADIVGDDHFGFEKYDEATVKSYNYKTGPIASNNLPINPLGFYDNPAFGTTRANFVTQLEMAVQNPTFNNAVIDSVILNIPYFSTPPHTKNNNTDEYVLDSIYGPAESKFKLSVYRSGYYLRDLDPNAGLSEVQSYYTDQDSDIDNNKIPVLLNDTIDVKENEQFFFNKKEIVTKTKNDKGEDVISKSAPAMRLHLNRQVFTEAILDAPSGQLASNAVFKNYFRGLYFKAEAGNPGNMTMINFKGGKITLYYKEDKDDTSSEKVSKTFVLNLSGNTVSLQNNSNENNDYLNAINNPAQEASRLYLKGGEGSIAAIDLFGDDTDGNKIADEIDVIRANGWMVNDASLTFYIDKSKMSDPKTAEPNRIFLYDLTNKKVLIDYAFDNTTNGAKPKNNKYVFDGIIQKENVSGGRGIKYRIRLTNHVRDLVKNGSKNVRLGLSVTENINNVAFSKLKNPYPDFDSAPAMSVMNPLGTVLYGSNILEGDENYDKRLKLEIYYTKHN